jgi:multimeric flavodoxin WrbA
MDVIFMKVILLDGSKKNDTDIKRIRSTLEEELGFNGSDVEGLELRNLKILPCTGCFDCWTKTPGICKIKDHGREVTKKMIQSDLLIFLTPVVFGGYSSELKKALDRSLGLMLPYFTKIQGKVHHKKRYKKYPSLLAVGTLSAPDNQKENIFKGLVSRNAINAHSPKHAAIVFVNGENDKVIRDQIKKLLDKVGVSG